MTNKIKLGKLKSDAGSYADGEVIWLTKHSWDCGWYWSFGYLGNRDCHFHFDSILFLKDSKGNILYTASDLFQETNISDKEWWVIRDLFVQAYALQKAAEVYRHGGHQTSQKGVTDVIQNLEMSNRLNEDLKKLLDTLWDFVSKAVVKKG